MKTKLPSNRLLSKIYPAILSIVLVFTFCPEPSALSQVPQGFNYQAIARDGSGNPIVGGTIDVRFDIQTDTSATPVILWEELHTGVKTNAFGLFTVILGQGARVTGTANTFNEINWSVTPLYLKTRLTYLSVERYMGSAKLWSVPYALVANDLGGPVKKLAVTGNTTVMDEALFEVKNKNGQTVFAVYNEGVRVYVADGLAKGQKGGFAIGGFGTDKGVSQPLFVVNYDSIRGYVYDNPLYKGLKGGFAIGGFNGTKASTNDYLLVSPDSVRIFVNNAPSTKGQKGGFAIGGFDPTKAAPQKLLTVSDDSIRMYIDDGTVKGGKGGFAIGSFDNTKGGNINYLNVSTDNNGIVNPAQNRVLWYPLNAKNAFLAGRVLIEKPDSVGVNSVSTGYESRAKGAQSQAFGYKAIARGAYSTAIGYMAVAHKDNSFAFGENVLAENTSSYSFGRGAQAKGLYSFAFGDGVITTASNSYSFGKSSTASGSNSFALGESVTASATSSYAFGKSSNANGQYSFAIGEQVLAGSSSAITNAYAMGRKSQAWANSSFAIGDSVYAKSLSSYAFGRKSIASNNYAIVMGYNSTASGLNAIAMGNGASASGASSFAINGSATADNSKAFGGTASGIYAFTAGNANTTATKDYSIAMGENVRATGNNSVAIGSGTYLFPTRTYNEATGNWAIAIGNDNSASGLNSVAIGAGINSTGAIAIGMGLNVTAQSFNSFVIGYDNEVSGTTSSWVETEPLFVVGNGSYGGRPSHNAFTILKNGNVGLNTSSPQYYLESYGVNASLIAHYLSNSRGGVAALTTGRVAFLSTASTDDLVFGYTSTIQANFSTSFVERMRIDNATGNVGIGNTAPGYKLDVTGTMRVTGALNLPDLFTRTVTTPRNLYCNAAGEIGGLSSSIKYKENVQNILNTDWLYQLRPVSFNYKNSDPSDIYYGLIAEEVAEVNPSLIIYGPDNQPDGLMIEKLTAPMLKAIQDQKKEIKSLTEKVDKLEQIIEQLLLEKPGK